MQMHMDRVTLFHVKSTVLHHPPSTIIYSKLLRRPRTVGYYHILEQ